MIWGAIINWRKSRNLDNFKGQERDKIKSCEANILEKNMEFGLNILPDFVLRHFPTL
jgi:hypothetical protein